MLMASLSHWSFSLLLVPPLVLHVDDNIITSGTTSSQQPAQTSIVAAAHFLRRTSCPLIEVEMINDLCRSSYPFLLTRINAQLYF